MSVSIDPGSINVRFRLGDDGRVAAASVACERPSVGALFQGRSVDSVLTLLPLVFAVCGKAQGAAIRAAVAAARGTALAPQLDAAVAAEAAARFL